MDGSNPITPEQVQGGNLEIWQSVEKTDPKHTKGFKRGGGFSGTATNPTYLARKATEQFGPCGIGWGVNVVNEQYVKGAPVDDKGTLAIVHVLQVTFWYELNGRRGEITAFGQTDFVGKNKYGPTTDEEAPKKSLTDAMTKAMSMLGFSADIHMGMYDDNKYVAEVRQYFAEDTASPPPKPEAKPDPAAYAAMLKKKIEAAPTSEKLQTVWDANAAGLDKLHKMDATAHQSVTDAFNIRMDALSQAPAPAEDDPFSDIPY